jgi:hypothetical protein
MGTRKKMAQILAVGSNGGVVATDQFPYDKEVNILLGSLVIKYIPDGKSVGTLKVNCGVKGFTTQDGISSIYIEGYSYKNREKLVAATSYDIYNKQQNKVSRKKDDGFFGFKSSVCGTNSGISRSMPDVMVDIAANEGVEIFPKFVEYALGKGMLWGFKRVYDDFVNWHMAKGIKRSDYYAAWRKWVVKSKEINPVYFQKNPKQRVADSLMELEKQVEAARMAKEGKNERSNS